MEYRINQRTGDRISVIGIGSGYITEAPEKEAMEALELAYENGLIMWIRSRLQPKDTVSMERHLKRCGIR